MPIYMRSAFEEIDLSLLDELAADHPFITLATVANGEPMFSHIPILYQRDDRQIVLRGHVARPNPHALASGKATAILHGPQHYVSPSWYPDKESAARVPTWNYLVAHLTGEIHSYDDETGLARIVSDLSRHFESSVGQAWQFDPMEPRFRSQLRGISGFEIHVTEISFKAKMSQNHPDANRRAAINALRQLDSPQARSVAQWMSILLERNQTIPTGNTE